MILFIIALDILIGCVIFNITIGNGLQLKKTLTQLGILNDKLDTLLEVIEVEYGSSNELDGSSNEVDNKKV
jgi:hypothetical protein